VISQDDREGQLGIWRKVIPVQGGNHYRFETFRRVHNAPSPRRSASVRIIWQDARGRIPPLDPPEVGGHLSRKAGGLGGEIPGVPPSAPDDFPLDRETDRDGWTEVSDVVFAPTGATHARIELYGQWAPGSQIEWTEPTIELTSKPPSRKVRLAAVHYKPKGPTPEANRQQFVPLIEQAAAQNADLLVLGETLTHINTDLSYGEVAEPIPGPSTEFFGKLAKQHGMYIVAGLCERSGPLVYNVAVLLDRDGNVAGKYRKVCLPEGEVAGGVTPGYDFPVFDTSFGKLGMMICYDGFFPEVARALANNGAEVIAYPVWGCEPQLIGARASENQVYIVSATYLAPNRNSMLTAVFDHAGETLTVAKEFGTVVVAEVDLNAKMKWGPGDFKGAIPRYRPVSGRETTE
jgi:predicted amidohydrolase